MTLLQSTPSDILVQSLGGSAAAPSSARPADPALTGTDAFAATLQSLLAPALSGVPNAIVADPQDLPGILSDGNVTLSAAGQFGFDDAAAQSSFALTSLPSPATLTSSSPSDADCGLADTLSGDSLVPVLAAMMVSSQNAAGIVETESQGVAAESTDSPAASQQDGETANRVEVKTPANGYLLWPDAARGEGQFLASQLPPVSAPTSGTPSLADGAGDLTQVMADPAMVQTDEQLVGMAVPARPGGYLVTSVPATQTDESGSQVGAALLGTESSQSPVTDASATALSAIAMTAKSLSAKPGSESVVDPVNLPVSSSADDSPFIAKSSASFPTVSSAPDPASASAATALTVKSAGAVQAAGISPEVRALVSKMTDLGLQSLSVRAGRTQTKSAERLESLAYSPVNISEAASDCDRNTFTALAAQPSGDPSSEGAAGPEELDRKRGERVAGAETRSVREPAQKESTGANQESASRSVVSSKATGAEQVESASSVRYIVEDQKPVRVPGQITVTLQPPELGRLKIDLLTGSSGIIGRLRFASDAVRTVVERDIAQLHRSLTDAGIRVERLDIVGVAPAQERSSVSSQTPGEQQTPQRQTQQQGRQGAPKENPWYTGRERNNRNDTSWMEQSTSPWVAMTVAAQGLNLVA